MVSLRRDSIADVAVMTADAHKFFVTGVKDLSTGVKYMDSKVDFWFYSYRCQVSAYRCQVYGFQSGVLVLFVPGGARGAKCVEVLCVEGGQNV